ncbi:NAD(P)/FAD-dependent oxidoreductase [Actinomadura sp. HBU206391]|uniref:dihydrolipoyl dehydrogenase family protein n=1 Tax=Actinomadura sp. HBU206391 TaxID=2731692 RepID=UPI002905D237|nr:NAD(P)/FAD-dependent oxidoreductase [Actinomadura sp. HBU206391]
MSDTYDVVVLGAGPAGENLADRAHAAGLSVVIVERELVGGECSYWACMPSKALLRPVSAVHDAERVEGARQAVSGDLDVAAVLARRDEFASHWNDDGQVSWLSGAGVDLVRGHGRLAGVRQVTVTLPDGGARSLTARHAVAVCTGSRAAIPPVPGLADARPWTSREATSAKRAPGRLIVVGGGVVGVEMATAWQALGSKVTLVARRTLLTSIEPFAGEIVAESLVSAGVEVRTGVSVTAVHRQADGEVTVRLEGGEELRGDEVLMAVGREPNTHDIGLETIGLAPGSWLAVSDTCVVDQVDEGWLYAVGDVNHRALLTHQGKYQARVAGDAIGAQAKGEPLATEPWGRHSATADHAAVPQVIFSDPEVAAVGLTAEQARREGREVKVVDYELGDVAGAGLYADGYRGSARMVVDTGRGHLVGATFVGPGVGEMLHAATIAVVGEVPIERLWHAVPSYPTISEIWLRFLEEYGC